MVSRTVPHYAMRFTLSALLISFSAACSSSPSQIKVDAGVSDDGLFSPGGCVFENSIDVTILPPTDSSTIIYTENGSDPCSSGNPYEGKISLSKSTWLRACVVDENGAKSKPFGQEYVHIDGQVAAFNSNLPVVLIDSHLVDVDEEVEEERPYRRVSAAFAETGNDGRSSVGGENVKMLHGGLHVRGSSSAEYPKKQYKFETWDQEGNDEAVSLLDLPEESDWVIHAPFSDKTLMRNYLMYSWSNKIGRYAPRSVFVELFFNSDDETVSMEDYRGVYVFMEKIKRDKNRVNVEKLSAEDNAEPEITGGYLLSHDWEEETEEDYETDFTTDLYSDRINFEYPKPSKITEQQRAWIKSYIDKFETSLATTSLAQGNEGFAGYIDVDSFVDHMLLVELGRNVDGYVLSTFMHKPRGGKLVMGPIWDYNGALGNAGYFDSELTDGWHYQNESFPADNPEAFEWWEVLLQDPDYLAMRSSRWQTLRQSTFSAAQLMADIDDAAALLDEAQARNFQQWPILGENIWPNDDGAEDRLTYAEEIAYLKTWVTARTEWLDSVMGGKK